MLLCSILGYHAYDIPNLFADMAYSQLFLYNMENRGGPCTHAFLRNERPRANLHYDQRLCNYHVDSIELALTFKKKL